MNYTQKYEINLLDLIKYINWLNKTDKTTLKTSTPITAQLFQLKSQIWLRNTV